MKNLKNNNSFYSKIRNWLLNHPRLNPYNLSYERTSRTITSSSRLLPDFIIIGYHKCGTTSLYDYICQHPNIGSASRKEIHYFDLSFWRGIGWYRTHFPTIYEKNNIEKKTNNKFLTGEASPLYVIHPKIPGRIYDILPKVKIIILLRNPIDRAYSHFQNANLANQESINFEKTIEIDDERWDILLQNLQSDLIFDHNMKKFKIPYRSFGKYIEHIKQWYDVFPKEQIQILTLEELENDLPGTLKKVFEFLNVPDFKIKDIEKKNVRKYDKMLPETRKLLIEYYKPYNKKLEEFLNMKFNWN